MLLPPRVTQTMYTSPGTTAAVATPLLPVVALLYSSPGLTLKVSPAASENEPAESRLAVTVAPEAKLPLSSLTVAVMVFVPNAKLLVTLVPAMSGELK